MSAVDDALERAENDPPAESWRAPMAQVVGDRTVLAAEVKRLRDLHERIADEVKRMRENAAALGIVDTRPNAQVAMYGRPGREPICDFDCDYCHEDPTLSEGHET